MSCRIYFIFILFVTSVKVQAENYDYLEMTSSFSKQAEEHTERHFDDETFQKLYEYRLSVQEQAYETTMQLCVGYKYVLNIVELHYYQQMSLGLYNSDPNVKLQTLPRQVPLKHGGGILSSLRAWSKLGYEGLVQPFSAIGGLKADYLSLRNISFLDAETWIKSLYALYLINSSGFLQAAKHCLGTIDKSNIESFAMSILSFDAVASGITHAALELTIGGVFTAVLVGARWSFRPVGKVTSRYASKLNARLAASSNPIIRQGYMKPYNWLSGLSSRQKKSFIAAGFMMATVLAGNYFYNRISEKNELEEAVVKALQDSWNKPEGYLKRSILFGDAVYLFTAIYQEHHLADREDIDCLECLDVFIPLNDFLKDYFDEETFSLMKEDYQFLREKEKMGLRDQHYLQTLENFLPLFEKMHQAQS